MNPKLAWLLMCASACCVAQTAPPTSYGPAPAPVRAPATRLVAEPATERGEPNVRHTVTEDQGAKIDELRVRGQVTNVTVTPKVGVTKPYEIIVPRGGRESGDGTGGAGSAVGKRVWNVFAF